MVEAHEFDSRWRQRPIGIVTDLALIDEEPDVIKEQCASFEWVEARIDATEPVPVGLLRRAGFIKVDTHIKFQLDLKQLAPKEPPGIKAKTFEESPFEVDLGTAYPFRMERFVALPRVGLRDVNRRYELWASQLCTEAAKWCVQVEDGDQVQGWFFSQPIAGHEIDLTLGVARIDSTIGGRNLFASAFSRYVDAGATEGSASFSVKSLAVMNIYSSFGAKFVGATDFWLRSPAWDPT